MATGNLDFRKEILVSVGDRTGQEDQMGLLRLRLCSAVEGLNRRKQNQRKEHERTIDG